MQVIKTDLPGVIIIEPKIFGDPRGFFFESFQEERYQQNGVNIRFVQDNVSRSQRGVLRGLHYQLERPQGKLVFVTRGAVFDVIVDVRKGSPTFGKVVTVELTEENHRQVYVPPGYAHGFCVLSEEADFFYKCTDYYHPASERGVRWDDPDLKIPWPITTPLLSEKDAVYARLRDIKESDLPIL